MVLFVIPAVWSISKVLRQDHNEVPMTDKGAIKADVGTVYRWEMESNPSTGYGWYLLSDEGLKVETEFITKSDLCGALGTHVFLISSDVKGTFELTAVYKRPWENVDPIDTKKLKITFC